MSNNQKYASDGFDDILPDGISELGAGMKRRLSLVSYAGTSKPSILSVVRILEVLGKILHSNI
jgi:hypothetical protein